MKNNEKPLCFVIMPFSSDYNDIYNTIKNAGELAGFITQRTDEQYSPGKIPDRIDNMLKNSQLLVAEISENNLNVYYELGLAHAKNKLVISICKEDASIPFDLNHWNHIKYKDVIDLGKKLSQAFFSMAEKITLIPNNQSKKIPEDFEVGQLAVKCGMINPIILDTRLSELQTEGCKHSSIIDLLIHSQDINEEQADLLSQAQNWVHKYLNSVSLSLKEPTWIRQLHRTVKLISWRNQFNGDKPFENRYIDILQKNIDVYDEAIFTDHIFFQKLKSGSFTALSTGLVVLHEMDTERYKCFIPKDSLKYYKNSGGHTLNYCLTINKNTVFPLLVERTFNYINGFQVSNEEDNCECGIGIKEPVEELILTVDFTLIPKNIENIKAELRYEDKVELLDIKKASSKCYYTTRSLPKKNSSVYISWDWK
jgi:hypothetical protein